MNEKLQYASMLEIPVNTCTITYKPSKKQRKRRKKDVQPEEVKEQLLQKVNNMAQQSNIEQQPDAVIEEQAYTDAIIAGDSSCQNPQPVDMENTSLQQLDSQVNELVDQSNLPQSDYIEDLYQPTSNVKRAKILNKSKKGRFKISLLGVQLAIIGILVATIFVTNALYSDSGVNVFLRGVFGVDSAQVDNRAYTEFTPVINNDDLSGYTLNEGVLTFSGTGSVYPAEDGTVTDVILDENGKYTLQITHNKNFVSVFSGLDYAYSQTGQKVYGTMPVGYVKGQVTMCFKGGDGNLISNYQVIDDTIVWSV